MLGTFSPAASIADLVTIMETVESAKSGDFAVAFDPTLVRGMSYYTGPIFEIAMDELGSSVGGGGRYDRMIGRFAGTDVPACGFSIGFERIILILMEQGFTVPGAAEKTAYLLDKNADASLYAKAFSMAAKDRSEGKCATVLRKKKNVRFQKEQLAAQGYANILDIRREEN